ncbi:MAG: folate family ECF transporter S component [Liquorilactobacillus nagelii]|jgi:ECF transporter S component (folate family)|uniref:ECF transporter S component n=1 Tax=Liquorilactobacillus nagelii TaxID=82688 RepID=A0A3Q8CBW8_9LACO|nr:folate family ECF transporter S component [Liquorilactobacillus nagelii]AUJ31887.1 ECF transporter S component [Liquorilactobacillus nagelii]MCC7615728.1 ECF transporter S component [Liquorilactobacillus nagelii]MCP9314034.1 folate family ECF transporter S component [Liquorilactobacillus nagelii]ULQ50118.1 folate family ECF transporter S component [Liquorilactobacillus nagelii]
MSEKNNFVSLHSPKLSVNVLTLSAILLALDVVFYKLAFGPAYIDFNLGFISTALMGYFLGPWLTAGLEMASDIIGTLLGGGTFAFPFLITAFLGGMVYGMFLHKSHPKVWSIILLNFLILFPISLVIDTWLIHVTYHVAWGLLFWSRLGRNTIDFVIQTILLVLVLQAIERTGLRKRFESRLRNQFER